MSHIIFDSKCLLPAEKLCIFLTRSPFKTLLKVRKNTPMIKKLNFNNATEIWISFWNSVNRVMIKTFRFHLFFISRVLRVFPDTISFFRVHDASPHDWSWGFAWLNDELLEGKIDIMKPYATRFFQRFCDFCWIRRGVLNIKKATV